MQCNAPNTLKAWHFWTPLYILIKYPFNLPSKICMTGTWVPQAGYFRAEKAEVVCHDCNAKHVFWTLSQGETSFIVKAQSADRIWWGPNKWFDKKVTAFSSKKSRDEKETHADDNLQSNQMRLIKPIWRGNTTLRTSRTKKMSRSCVWLQQLRQTEYSRKEGRDNSLSITATQVSHTSQIRHQQCCKTQPSQSHTFFNWNIFITFIKGLTTNQNHHQAQERLLSMSSQRLQWTITLQHATLRPLPLHNWDISHPESLNWSLQAITHGPAHITINKRLWHHADLLALLLDHQVIFCISALSVGSGRSRRQGGSCGGQVWLVEAGRAHGCAERGRHVQN